MGGFESVECNVKASCRQVDDCTMLVTCYGLETSRKRRNLRGDNDMTSFLPRIAQTFGLKELTGNVEQEQAREILQGKLLCGKNVQFNDSKLYRKSSSSTLNLILFGWPMVSLNLNIRTHS